MRKIVVLPSNLEEFCIIRLFLKFWTSLAESSCMKTLFFVITLVFTLFTTETFAGDVSSMVQDELQRTQNEVSKTLNAASSRLAELRALKEKALTDSKKRGEEEVKGKGLMEKYATLLFARYRNEKNEFEVGMVISEKDQENVNKLFQTYLSSQPLNGPTSAGEAKRVLEIGARNLGEVAKLHLNPSDKNNSQLEILEYQVQNAELSLKRANELASTLGVNSPSGRAPASENLNPAPTTEKAPTKSSKR